MQKIIISLLLLTFTVNSFCQTIQKGLVREMNSKKKPIAGVQIKYIHAKATDSDITGAFTLVFERNVQPGQTIILEEIKKNGFEVVNDKNLQQLKLSNDTKFEEDIILAKSGVIDSAKAVFHGASIKALTAGLKREKESLMAQLKNAKLSQDEYFKKLESLQEEFDKQNTLIAKYADEFARINFDDVSHVYQDALTLFKNGKIQACISKLDSLQLLKRADRRIEVRNETIKKLKENEKGIREDIKLMQLAAKTNILSFEYNKAETYFDKIYELDSTDINILRETANFYREQHRYEKAKNFYSKIIAHPQAQKWQKANAYSDLGDLYSITGDLTKAQVFFQNFSDAYAILFKADTNSFHKNNLAISYSKLGETYTSLGNLNKALELYELRAKIGKELYDAYPKNVDFKNGLAISYEKLGETHTSLGNLNKALEFYDIETKLFKELYHAYPNNVDFKNGLAISYSKLGEVHTSLGNLNKALGFYEISSKIAKENYDAYPNNVSFKGGLSISYEKLGETHTSLDSLNKALKFFEMETKLKKELYEAYPNNVSFKNGLAISYSKLGSTHTSLGNLDTALKFHEIRSKISKELYYAYPNNVIFKNGLAISYEKLGSTHTSLGNFNKAFEFFETENKIFKELYDAYLNNVSFKNGLAISYEKLGETHTSLGNLNKALEFYEKDLTITRELYDAYPNNVSFKNGLAICYYKLAMIVEAKDLEKAISYLKESVKHFEELIKNSTNFIPYIKQYFMINGHLNDLIYKRK